MQDWWNLVIWDNPDLVHFLDCGFNFQTMEEFNQPPFDQVHTHIALLQCSLTSCLLELPTNFREDSQLWRRRPPFGQPALPL